jgi:hypothetical protein
VAWKPPRFASASVALPCHSKTLRMKTWFSNLKANLESVKFIHKLMGNVPRKTKTVSNPGLKSLCWFSIVLDCPFLGINTPGFEFLLFLTFSCLVFIYLFIYFCGTGVWTQGLHLEPLHQTFLWWVFSR